MSASEIDRSERLHGLDALRGGALLLGVVLHASMSFIPAPIWIVADDRQSVWAGVLFFAIHLFRMATFFLLAGLFAHMMLGRRGVGGFLKDRFIRIGGPLGVFWTPAMAGDHRRADLECGAAGGGGSDGTAAPAAHLYLADLAPDPSVVPVGVDAALCRRADPARAVRGAGPQRRAGAERSTD
jgi:hypothetical protein